MLGNDMLKTKAIRSRLSNKGAETETITMSEDDVVNIVSKLRSVLSITTGGYVQALHATFHEFLLDPKRCTDGLYFVDEREGNTALGLACIALQASRLSR